MKDGNLTPDGSFTENEKDCLPLREVCQDRRVVYLATPQLHLIETQTPGYRELIEEVMARNFGPLLRDHKELSTISTGFSPMNDELSRLTRSARWKNGEEVEILDQTIRASKAKGIGFYAAKFIF